MNHLDELKGQPIALRMLQVYSKEPLPPLLILHGPEGTGKYSAALALMKIRFCEIGTGCGVCASCRRFDHGNHADAVIFPEDKVLIGSEEKPEEFTVRWLQQTRIPYSPFDGKERIVMFPAAHLIQHEAVTALLKTLEEPPSHTRFIFLAHNKEELMQTILSRGVLVPFQHLPSEEVARLTKGAFSGYEDLLGGSLKAVPFLLTELKSELEKRIDEALDNPVRMLQFEKWILSGEKTGFEKLQGDDPMSFPEIVDIAGMMILKRSENHPARLEIAQEVFRFKEVQNREMPGMFPYAWSAFTARLTEVLFS